MRRCVPTVVYKVIDTYIVCLKEIDELVDEWTPEPLCAPLSEWEQHDLDTVPVIQGANGPRPKIASTGKTVLNLASYNFTGLAGNKVIEERAIETLRKYGLGSCGPPGFYGTIGKIVFILLDT